LHLGEPKTWYGVPARYADKFEQVFEELVPELFQSDPDLLHHLTTALNPNVLEKHGVPVYRTDQCAGEFIVTWPRAYHSGFNQGFNIAEAVNFAPIYWVEVGRLCIENYCFQTKPPVFSHEELICRMAEKAEELSIEVAAATYQNLHKIINAEKQLRKPLINMGVTKYQREVFEYLPDNDENHARQCSICKTTCFLSAIQNQEWQNGELFCEQELFCLRHLKSMNCDPRKLKLWYRYTIDELISLLRKLFKLLQRHEVWVKEVTEAMGAQGDAKLDIKDLKLKVNEFEMKGYPESELSVQLLSVVNEANSCLTTIKRMKIILNCDKLRSYLTLEEVQLFCDRLQELPVKIEGCQIAKQLLELYRNSTTDVQPNCPE
jgi:histone demethylase JARID1